MQPPEARKGNGLLRTGAEAGQACEMQPDGETLNEPDGIGPQSSRQGRLRQTHENFVNFEELLKRISCFQVILHLLDSPSTRPATSAQVKHEARIANRPTTEPCRRHVRFLQMTLNAIQQFHGLPRLTQHLCSCFVLSRKVPSSLGDFLLS